MVKLRPSSEWPLGLIALLVAVPVLAVIVYLFWSNELEFLQSGDPLLRNIPMGHAALLIFIAILAVVSLFVGRRGPEDETQNSDTSDRD